MGRMGRREYNVMITWAAQIFSKNNIIFNNEWTQGYSMIIFFVGVDFNGGFGFNVRTDGIFVLFVEINFGI